LVRDYERLPETLAGLHLVAFVFLMLQRIVVHGIPVHNTL
ncbi:MAG: IS5/IS1182 family transposase, partial [Thermomicrobia bacterium]|nr:IS5/IS1182 family transposase [Thermomicrobia bacterium]